MLLAFVYLWVLGFNTLNSLKESAKICLVDDLWLMLEAGGLEMVLSEVPVYFFHRCSTLLVMIH